LAAEWLAVAARQGLRVPPELLPDLLEVARRDPALRPLVVAAGGARVAWLAAQNPLWSYVTATADAAAGDDPRAWDEGTPGQRVAYLTGLRARDPDAGRALLAGEWAGLGPEERTHLLAALGTGLGPADEEILEGALDDRRREVRVVAADLLGALPSSGYGGRMAERARAAVSVVDGQVRVTPPAACDEGMRRDGIVAKPPPGTGERAWWLEQVLARTPPDAWTDLTPQRFLELPVADDWASTVYRGLARAAAHRRDPAWAAALVPVVQTQSDLLEPLYAALAPADLADRAVAACRVRPMVPEALGRAEWLLHRVPGPWSDELAAAALLCAVAAAGGGKGSPAAGGGKGSPAASLPSTRVDSLCRLAAMRMPPHRAPETARLAERFAAERPATPAVYALNRLAETLALRHEMIQELT
jgi:hypothetical protein